jgi:LysM repeat protein
MSQNGNKIAGSWTKRAAAILASALVAVTSIGATSIAPAQAAAPARQEVGAYVCTWYRVRAGDTLLELAARYNTDVLTLRRVNGLKTTRIYTGQRLCIPRYVKPNPQPPQPPASGPWQAAFWNNTSLSGSPVLVRTDAAVNFNWGFGSPDPSRVFSDFFSARWIRQQNFNAGTWRFTVNADDGFRLYVDGNLVADYFTYVGNQTRTVDVPLAAGAHVVQLEYVEQTGNALVRLTYQQVAGPVPPPLPPDGDKFRNGPWYTEYFANATLTPPPSAVRTEPGIRFAWNGAPPVPGLPGSFWSARFTQTRFFNAGVYQFVARVDDGVRIWINGVQIMNEWREQSTRTFTSNVKLGSGNYNIVVEYAQFGGSSDFALYWDFLGNPDAPQQPQVLPQPLPAGPIPYIPPQP